MLRAAMHVSERPPSGWPLLVWPLTDLQCVKLVLATPSWPHLPGVLALSHILRRPIGPPDGVSPKRIDLLAACPEIDLVWPTQKPENLASLGGRVDTDRPINNCLVRLILIISWHWPQSPGPAPPLGLVPGQWGLPGVPAWCQPAWLLWRRHEVASQVMRVTRDQETRDQGGEAGHLYSGGWVWLTRGRMGHLL